MRAARAGVQEEDEFAMAQDEFAQLIEFLRSRHSRELSHTELEAVSTIALFDVPMSAVFDGVPATDSRPL